MVDFEQEKTSFLAFHALNEFMLPEYRLEVLQRALSSGDSLPGELKGRLAAQVRQSVQVPGFRNSTLAPLPLKIKGAVKAFEKSPAFVALVLAAWAESNRELRQQVFDLLTARGWQLLPLDADRTKLPGFLTRWPKDESYEVINQAFSSQYPASTASEFDVRLMTVWLSTRLPVELVDSKAGKE